jgi:hypothetical protein
MELELEIVEVNEIDGGIEVFARAWRDGSQIGFGRDGSVDIERFRIFNPPVLVPDVNGDVTREGTNIETSEVTVHTYREDPQTAVLESLAHTISNMQNVHGAENIVEGKRGNTTSTFYPDANTETTSFDGCQAFFSSGGTWVQALDQANSNDFISDSNVSLFIDAQKSGSNWNVGVSQILFDTSALPDSDTIDSAVFSIKRNDTIVSFQNANASSAHLVGGNPASNTAISTSDYGSRIEGTSFGSFLYSSTSDEAYADITLNSSGLSNITKTGVSKFVLTTGQDVNRTEPTGTNRISFHSADASGTTNDPKLVVEHSAPASTFIPRISFVM